MHARVAALLVLASCGDNVAVVADAADAARDAASDAPTSAGWQCDGTTGLVAPLLPCSPAHPCGSVTTSFHVPECKTRTTDHPMFDDGAPRTWSDAVTGDPRAACVFRPGGSGARPLVVFFHGATAWQDPSAAALVYDRTSLRAKAASFDLENNPARLGYVLAADEGQTLENPNSLGGGAAIRHDVYYRDLRSPSTNPDIRNADRLIDELVAEGGIDPKRIYVVGWSNGGLFAQEYAIARHATATPGGNRVAAAASYVGPDPLENLAATQSPSCAYRPLPVTDVPIDVVHRDCDSIATCDAAQQAAFGTPPGFDVTAWEMTLRTTMADPNVVDSMYDAAGVPVTACASTTACTAGIGATNHGSWPDGVADASGLDHEPELLAFLRDHPLP